MFNNHFFSHRQNYEGFVKRAKNLFVVVDPPYGGIVQLIANTIESIRRDFEGDKISIFLIYPYFIQKWIEKWLPDFQMLDYKVSLKQADSIRSTRLIDILMMFNYFSSRIKIRKNSRPTKT